MRSLATAGLCTCMRKKSCKLQTKEIKAARPKSGVYTDTEDGCAPRFLEHFAEEVSARIADEKACNKLLQWHKQN